MRSCNGASSAFAFVVMMAKDLMLSSSGNRHSSHNPAGRLCAARACSRVCTVKAPHLAALMTKAFFRKCQNRMKEGRAAEAGGTFCESGNQISGIDSSARDAHGDVRFWG